MALRLRGGCSRFCSSYLDFSNALGAFLRETWFEMEEEDMDREMEWAGDRPVAGLVAGHVESDRAAFPYGRENGVNILEAMVT